MSSDPCAVHLEAFEMLFPPSHRGRSWSDDRGHTSHGREPSRQSPRCSSSARLGEHEGRKQTGTVRPHDRTVYDDVRPRVDTSSDEALTGVLVQPVSSDERRVASDGDISVEELGESDCDVDCGVILRPDDYEDPATGSEKCSDNGSNHAFGADSETPSLTGQENDHMIRRFEGMHVTPRKEPDRRSRQRERWTASFFKRSHSQCIGSDTDMDDDEALDGHDLACAARRLRRRVRGPVEHGHVLFGESKINARRPESPELADSRPSVVPTANKIGVLHQAPPAPASTEQTDLEQEAERTPVRLGYI